ncbi:hypothetical protein [Candidatus Methylacidiphilum infernorum]|uniref:hypothetical protein n=1 Tax=Candidatus Methylacidiphilum infernorum TaxID=511746 RepID=UPI001F5CF0DC|nr:hypothetical protein [Candidatus Methylacidiphilum infernorum]
MQLGVGTENQLASNGGPSERCRFPLPSLEELLACVHGHTIGAHVEQVDEKVVGKYSRSIREYPMLAPPHIGIQTMPLNKPCHLRCREGQELCLVDR